MIRAITVVSLLAACSKERDVSAEDRARGAAIIGDLKKSLVGALQGALHQGAPSAIAMCHELAPNLAATLSRDGAIVGRATRKPRNPRNEASGWQADALTEFERKHAERALAGATFARRLPDGRVAYAEPLIIQELCVTCHGQNVAPDVRAVLAENYPADKATGYAVGDLRGIAWVELQSAGP
jgi:hypothetical protein